MANLPDPRLVRLVQLAQLVRDARLADLSRHVQACAATQARIAALNAPMPQDTDLPTPTLALVALLHDRWAAPRRLALNEQLVRQTAARSTAELAAKAAFGRALVLGRLSEASGGAGKAV